MSIELIIGIMGIVVPSLTSVALLILRQKEKQKNKEWEKEIKDQMRLYDLQKSNQEDCYERIEKLEKLLSTFANINDFLLYPTVGVSYPSFIIDVFEV